MLLSDLLRTYLLERDLAENSGRQLATAVKQFCQFVGADMQSK